MKNTKTNNEKVTDSSGENLAPIQFLVQQTTQTNQVLDNATMQIAADNRIPMAELKVQWGHPWNDVYECNDVLLEDWINLGVDTQTGVVLSAEYLTSRGYTSDKLVRAGVYPQDLIATAGVNQNFTENIIGPDALKIYEKFNTQIPQRPLKFKYTETTTNPTTKVKTIVRSTKISVPVNVVKKIAEYLTPVKSDAIFGTDIMRNIKPQDLQGVHSEWLKLLNSDQAQKLALRDSILIPQYNSTASSFKENLAKLKTILKLDNNPIESVCDALQANNKFSNYEQQEKNNKFEPLLEIALYTTCCLVPDSAQIKNPRYKKIVEDTNNFKTLLKNSIHEKEQENYNVEKAKEIQKEITQYLDKHNVATNLEDKDGSTINSILERLQVKTFIKKQLTANDSLIRSHPASILIQVLEKHLENCDSEEDELEVSELLDNLRILREILQDLESSSSEDSDSEDRASEGGESEVSALEDSELEDRASEGDELKVKPSEGGELEVSAPENNAASASESQILSKRLHAQDNNAAPANKRQKTAHDTYTSVLQEEDILASIQDDNSINQESNLDLNGLVASSSEEL